MSKHLAEIEDGRGPPLSVDQLALGKGRVGLQLTIDHCYVQLPVGKVAKLFVILQEWLVGRWEVSAHQGAEEAGFNAPRGEFTLTGPLLEAGGEGTQEVESTDWEPADGFWDCTMCGQVFPDWMDTCPGCGALRTLCPGSSTHYLTGSKKGQPKPQIPPAARRFERDMVAKPFFFEGRKIEMVHCSSCGFRFFGITYCPSCAAPPEEGQRGPQLQGSWTIHPMAHLLRCVECRRIELYPNEGQGVEFHEPGCARPGWEPVHPARHKKPVKGRFVSHNTLLCKAVRSPRSGVTIGLMLGLTYGLHLAFLSLWAAVPVILFLYINFRGGFDE